MIRSALSGFSCILFIGVVVSGCDDSNPGLVFDAGVDTKIEGLDATPDSLFVDAVVVDADDDPDSDSATTDLPLKTADAYVPVGPFGCFDPGQVGTSLGQIGNITIYSGCSITKPKYLLVWGGAAKALGQQDVSAIKKAKVKQLMAINGMWGAGVGSCCGSPLTSFCVRLYVSANTLTLHQLAQELNQVLAGEKSCFGMIASVPGPLGPRCVPSATEPCDPLPYCKKKTWTGCAGAPSYQPGAPRKPTLAPGSYLELPQSAGECKHDGECVQGGCGNSCVAYTAPTGPAICPWVSSLVNSFCGCVSGTCVWFEQS